MNTVTNDTLQLRGTTLDAIERLLAQHTVDGDTHGLLGQPIRIDGVSLVRRQQVEQLRAGHVEHIQVDLLLLEQGQRRLQERIGHITSLKHDGSIAIHPGGPQGVHALRGANGGG